MMLITPGVPLLGSFLYTGVYDIPNLSFTCDGWFTNMVSTDAYRGAGRPEASYAIERIMDIMAGEVGITPEEIRARNYIAGGEAFENHEASASCPRARSRSCPVPRRTVRVTRPHGR